MIKLAHNKLATHTQAELDAKGLSERQIQTLALKNIKSLDAAYELKEVFNNQEALNILGHAQHSLQMKICNATIAYHEFKKYEADNS
tara:strand:+ start:272 stop:532 length:261 start_codon:yes stop_codon:yes gene_type:complete